MWPKCLEEDERVRAEHTLLYVNWMSQEGVTREHSEKIVQEDLGSRGFG